MRKNMLKLNGIMEFDNLLNMIFCLGCNHQNIRNPLDFCIQGLGKASLKKRKKLGKIANLALPSATPLAASILLRQ